MERLDAPTPFHPSEAELAGTSTGRGVRLIPCHMAGTESLKHNTTIIYGKGEVNIKMESGDKRLH